MEVRKVWVSRFALTQGVFEAEVKFGRGGGCVTSDGCTYITRGGWHETKEAALEHARFQKDARLTYLKKQLARIESLEFS